MKKYRVFFEDFIGIRKEEVVKALSKEVAEEVFSNKHPDCKIIDIKPE